MIFQFPDLETLRIALTSGQIPPEVASASAEVGFDSQGRPSVSSRAVPPKTMQTALKRLGVKTAKTHHGEPVAVSCWPEILSIVKETTSPEITSATAVLFELPEGQLADLATEMLRLGNDRQSFRSVADADGAHVLLRVIGPPYYTLLRALDRLNADVVAYVEKAPRVWVEIGHAHPLAASMKIPEGQVLLLRPPRRWISLKDGPFQDIYDIVDFQLPKASVDYAEGKLESKLSVPLRLTPGNAADASEMWVLKDNAVDIFDAFVRDADERLMGRLMFAVAEQGDAEPMIILRVRQLLKLTPPSVELPGAAGFTRYRKLNNVFVPTGYRLQPTLRRDAVRKMLAEDDARIVWLTPAENGGFVPESLPDEAFRPLQDWVDYVIDRERQALQSWVQAVGFDFESFICKGDLPDEPPSAPPKPAKRKPDAPSDAEDDETKEPQIPKGKKIPTKKTDEEAYSAATAAAPPSEWKKQRNELETAFLAVDGAIDSPERSALWPALAQANGMLEDHAEAAICWFNSLWEREDLPVESLKNWLAIESKKPYVDLTAPELDHELARETPTQGDMRRLAVRLLIACAQTPIAPILQRRLPAIRQYLERHDDNLGVRATWLVWRHLTKVSGDVLGLARVRDRLIERLFGRGLNKEMDLARFIRLSNDTDGHRLREILDRTFRIREKIRKWMTLETPSLMAVNNAYADLMFSFGFASLLEGKSSRELLTGAANVLSRVDNSAKEKDEAHALILEGFRYRIAQALAGNAHSGSLPVAWHKAFEQFREQVGKIAEGSDRRKVGPFIVERFREQSWIFEPNERLNPYLSQTRLAHELSGEIASMAELREPGPLGLRIKNLLFDRKKSKYPPNVQVIIAKDVLPMRSRVSAEFTRSALELMPALVLENLDSNGQPIGTDVHLPENMAKLLERGLALAVYFEIPELVKKFAALFDRLLDIQSDQSFFDVINHGATQCIRSLRKRAMNEEIHALLVHIELQIGLREKKLKTATIKMRANLLCAHLHVAGIRLYLGQMPQALSVLDEARDFLFKNSPNAATAWHPDYARLMRTYINALSHAPIGVALERVDEMFDKCNKVANTFTSASHYSRLHLNVIEEFIICFMQPESLLGETARRWLDDDEYLVRRRIHGDMKRLLASAGL